MLRRVAPVLAAVVSIGACQPKPVAPGSANAPPPESVARTRTPADIAQSSTPAVVSVRTEDALGTGFLVSNDGLIVSNLHVIAGKSKVTVTLADHREYDVVEIWSGDRDRDLVIMRIEAQKLPALHLGDSHAVRPGDAVVAIGHPLGLEDTVSNGLVSAVRQVDEGLTVLQISAPIAPGSSGGPLFNDRGDVIGVATAIMLGGQNLNFGVPIDYVKELLKRPAPVSPVAFATATADDEDEDEQHRRGPSLPVQILDGCTTNSIGLLIKSIGEAIDVGTPLYNAGNFAGCYHVYDGAAADLERKLRSSCHKPARTLADGRRKAARLDDPSDQAWAMRDTFDSLLDVAKRWQGPAKKSPPKHHRH